MRLGRALEPDRFHRICLGPLPVDSLVRIVEGRFKGRFVQPMLCRIAATSGGNPLFALDIARSLDPSTPLEAGEPLPVPGSLQALVASRVASLSESACTSLLAAAALFHPTTGIVERASSEAGLAEGEEAQVVRIERGRVVFVHPLYASAVYSGAATSRLAGHDDAAGCRRLRGAGETPGAWRARTGRGDRRRTLRGRPEGPEPWGLGLGRRTDGAGATLDARGRPGRRVPPRRRSRRVPCPVRRRLQGEGASGTRARRDAAQLRTV